MEKIKYLQKYFDGPCQGSQEWLDMRNMRFGGSELKHLKKPNEIVKNRNTRTNENLFCWWGKWFETVTKKHLNKNIYEFGAIPCAKIPVAYSPDGLIIPEDDKENLQLIEIKCPILKENVDIKDYDDQIQAGMYILPVKNCLLLIGKYKKCDFTQLPKYCEYDAVFHKPWLRNKPYRVGNRYKYTELWCGVLIWDSDNKQETFELRHPDHIEISADHQDIIKYIVNMKDGHFMCFKCFDIEEHVVEPSGQIKEQEDLIWKKYKEFLELKRKSETNVKIKKTKTKKNNDDESKIQTPIFSIQ